ncbi:hypothetical protein FQP85_07420 [Pseudoalteromonas neustonica]|uniref:DUF4097 domain-containing protein n=1 Tax=Pseudoalteromonas neustonica TaxID=1840331 RepID=A0ABY3FF20_9GAMM|nr:hypothetical protein [Pseudoalteromonas neustonica]TVU84191.1 hypothetical protein FQP85_07420 [Pseudoalteromonas neustonica]
MINAFTRLTLIGTVLLSTQALAWNNEMTLQDTKKLTLDAQSLSALNVEAGSGFLHIVGSSTDTVTVKAEIYQYEAHDNYCLTLDKSGNSAKLTANNCDNHSEDHTRIDLTVSLPATFLLDITDGSGEISIENAAETSIHDGSGAIIINNISGQLTIEDGSGAITASNITDSVNIHDGSGSIELANTQGDVIIHDGSGNIDVQNIVGKVTVTDGSGGIYVNKAGSFTLLADGSGSVTIKNVPVQNL